MKYRDFFSACRCLLTISKRFWQILNKTVIVEKAVA
jgi:hypothetical protein